VKREPGIPARQPDIQCEPRPQKIPQDKDVPEKDPPPMQLQQPFEYLPVRHKKGRCEAAL
jgi:hypothetical protein